MKVNKLPEKIYVTIMHPVSDKYTEMIAFEHGDGIEYIRKSVFIKKAKEWFDEIENGTRITDIESFWNDFKNYVIG